MQVAKKPTDASERESSDLIWLSYHQSLRSSRRSFDPLTVVSHTHRIQYDVSKHFASLKSVRLVFPGRGRQKGLARHLSGRLHHRQRKSCIRPFRQPPTASRRPLPSCTARPDMPRSSALPEAVTPVTDLVAPPAPSPIIAKLRTDWRWAAISQFIWTFSDAFNLPDWDIEVCPTFALL